MYYYGYNGGYAGGNSMMYNNYPGYYSNGYGYGAAHRDRAVSQTSHCRRHGSCLRGRPHLPQRGHGSQAQSRIHHH